MESSILRDIKPWDEEKDMAQLEACVHCSTRWAGLEGSQLVPVGYHIHKLRVWCMVEDDKVSTNRGADHQVWGTHAEYWRCKFSTKSEQSADEIKEWYPGEKKERNEWTLFNRVQEILARAIRLQEEIKEITEN